MVYLKLPYFWLHCQKVLIVHIPVFILLQLQLMVTESSSNRQSPCYSTTDHKPASLFDSVNFRLQACFVILAQVDRFSIPTQHRSTVTQIDTVNLIPDNKTGHYHCPSTLCHLLILFVVALI